MDRVSNGDRYLVSGEVIMNKRTTLSVFISWAGNKIPLEMKEQGELPPMEKLG